MRSWSVGWTAVLVLLFVATPVLAANGTLQGHAGTPIQVLGDRQATASEARFFLAGDAGQASLLLQGAEGKATRVIQHAFGIVNSQNPKAQVLWSQHVETQDLDLRGALLTLDSRQPEFQALAYDATADLATGARHGPLLVGVGKEPVAITEDLTPPLSVQVLSEVQPFQHEIPAGLHSALANDGRLTLDGSFHLFLAGATIGWHPAAAPAQEIQAYFHKETRDGGLYNPLTNQWFGVGSHDEFVQEYIVVEATSGHVDLQFAGLPGTLYAGTPTIAVQGNALLPAMTGTVTVQDKDQSMTYNLNGQDLTLSGRFTVRLHDADATGTRVSGDGDFTTVSYGSVNAHYDWASTVVAVGIGALALAGLAWAGVQGKAIIGSLGGALAGYARVHGQEVLEHPGRAEVYERVKAFPGVNFVQLSAQVEFGASTLNYHLRVLEKNGYITSVRDGRYLRFFDRTSGSYAGTKKMAVSALRNETSAAMAKHIRDHPGVAQCDLATAFGVTPSTVTWHINRLSGQGLVQKSREAQHTRYYIGEAWASLPVEEQARQAPVPLAVTA